MESTLAALSPADRLSAVAALTPEQRAQFLAGTLTLVYDADPLKQVTPQELAAAVAAYRADPLFFTVPSRAHPESGAEGK